MRTAAVSAADATCSHSSVSVPASPDGRETPAADKSNAVRSSTAKVRVKVLANTGRRVSGRSLSLMVTVAALPPASARDGKPVSLATPVMVTTMVSAVGS